MLVDNSKYKKEHDKIIEFLKNQLNIDLNQYRDGDGTSPYATTYWDLNGPKLAVNHQEISIFDMNRIKTLGLLVETGGAWFSYISFKK